MRSGKFEFFPLTPERWPDFEKLFGANGACGGCWCMTWRRPRKEFNANKGAGNKAAMKALVDAGREPGILAYEDGKAVGWCALAPRTEYTSLERARILKPVDDDPVWAVSCFFIAKTHRRRGLTAKLLEAAVAFVAARGGKLVEGYPVEPKSDDMPVVFAWTGMASAFLKAGFKEHRRPAPARPIMRIETTRRKRR